MRAGRPNELMASIAARAVRPVKKTSSTMITVFSSSGRGSERLEPAAARLVFQRRLDASRHRSPRSQSYLPEGFNDFAQCVVRSRRRANGIPARTTRGGLGIPLDDFVRDPTQRASMASHPSLEQCRVGCEVRLLAVLMWFLSDLAGSR